MMKQSDVKLNRLTALAQEWARNPKFKEDCRKIWDPLFFAMCEEKIEKLRQINLIESRHNRGDGTKFLDISEINVEGW